MFAYESFVGVSTTYSQALMMLLIFVLYGKVIRTRGGEYRFKSLSSL